MTNHTGHPDRPSVSVIVLSFNNGRFIGAAIDSLLQQTYSEEDTELIIVDDGSTDGTASILEKHRRRAICVCQHHGGIAAAGNAGISRARGEIITFLDSDDIWHKERLRKVVEKFMEEHSLSLPLFILR